MPLHEVPAVAVQVLEDDHRAVGLSPRLLNEMHAGAQHPSVGRGQVFGVEEESDSPAGLITDARLLGLRGSPGQQQSSPAVVRRDHDPALPGAQRSVLEELEPEGTDVETNSLVVVVDDNRHQRDPRHAPIVARGRA